MAVPNHREPGPIRLQEAVIVAVCPAHQDRPERLESQESMGNRERRDCQGHLENRQHNHVNQ